MRRIKNDDLSVLPHLLAGKGFKVIEKLSSRTNSVFLCDSNESKKILKVYQNQYFPKQSEYEREVYEYLISKGFTNMPELYGTIRLDSVNLECNIFNYISDSHLGKGREQGIGAILPSIVKVLDSLHIIEVPWEIIAQHPQEKSGNPLSFIVENTVRKLEDKYGTFDFGKRLRLEGLKRKDRVLSHRDVTYKHIINTDKIYLLDFEDAGAFPPEVDFSALLKDMIEHGEDTKTISPYLKLVGFGIEDLWDYLIRTYLIDFAYSSNPNSIKFEEFRKIMDAESPETGLNMLVKANEISPYNR